MARTTRMSLIELLTMTDDVANVIEYLGGRGTFQLQDRTDGSESHQNTTNFDRDFLDKIQKTRVFLGIKDLTDDILKCPKATQKDRDDASKIIAASDDLSERYLKQTKEVERLEDAHKEAQAFSNLKVQYSELEHLSFLSLRIGKIPKENLPLLKASTGGSAVIVPLGSDESRIMAATSKKGRFALDTELKKLGFVEVQLPKDFKGIPEDVLESLRAQLIEAKKTLSQLEEERENFAAANETLIYHLIKAFSVGARIGEIQNSLESTAMVYRITGWVPENETKTYAAELDKLTEGRLAFREYSPFEVPSVIAKKEQVPVKLKHGAFVKSFERMIFSYGSPLYGTVDPTPFVAVFFTLLFGIMFGDAGQGLVFLLAGILMARGIIKVGGWNKFAPIFMGIGASSMVMGLVTGEFFTNEEILKPFALWVTGLFGTPRAPILKVMPSSDPNSILIIFGIFGVTIAIGFIINSIGLIINLINNITLKRWGAALFGKSGLTGIIFFWYVITFALRIAFLHHAPNALDWAVIGTALFLSAFGEPFERLVDGKRPVNENGVGVMIISGFVEMIEVISTYLSCTISFVRVGAFALAHAVLGFIIALMTEKSGVGGALVLIVGNGIVLVLEGMIVAIQVIRLQYYEFFSKFFNETGREFHPLEFHYKNI